MTHRTVYNHFPSREALNDAFAEYVEDEFAAAVAGGAPPDASLTLSSIASLPDEAYAGFDRHSRHVHAAVMLMIASQDPAQVTRDRTDRFAQVLERELEHLSPETARLSAAALRMFASSTAWHLMTQYLGLSTDEARRTAIRPCFVQLPAATTREWRTEMSQQMTVGNDLTARQPLTLDEAVDASLCGRTAATLAALRRSGP